MANTPPAEGPGRAPVSERLTGVKPQTAVPASASDEKERKENVPEPGLSPLFVTNLVAILLVGVGFCAWILYYTDWFPAIGGLLALGGVVSWLAFVSRVLPDHRLEALQGLGGPGDPLQPHHADRAGSPGGRRAGLRRAFSERSRSSRCASPRTGSCGFIRSDSAPGDDVRLRAGEVVRRPVWTSWWSSTPLRVKVSGYPDEVVTVRPWRRESLSVPASFQRPVVLLRPRVDLFDLVHNSPRRLSVRVTFPQSPSSPRPAREFLAQSDGQPLKFDGRALWIGCDEDVDIPLRLEAAWRAELAASQRSSMINYWLRPSALAGRATRARGGVEDPGHPVRSGGEQVRAGVRGPETVRFPPGGEA